MSATFSQSKASIKADLAEISQLRDFISITFSVYGRAAELMGWLNETPTIKSLILDFKNTKLNDVTVLYSYLYVQVWAAFELFLRNVLNAYVAEFCSRRSDFAALDKAGLIKKNIYNTARLLRNIYEEPALDYLVLTRKLGTLGPNTKPNELNGNAFSAYLGAPTVNGIEEALGRIAITNFDWDRLGERSDLQQLFGTRKARETTKELKVFLQSSAKKRNNIVHRGDKIQPITEAELTDAIKTVEAIALGLVDILEKDCIHKSS